MRVAHARAVAAHGLRDGRHGVVLPDDASVQFALEFGETLTLGLGETVDRDAGGPADHGCDLGLADDRLGTGTRRSGRRLVESCLHRADLVAEPHGVLVVLRRDGRVLVGLERRELRDERAHVDFGAQPQAQARAGLIDEVDRLVRQHALGQVPIAQLDGGTDGLVGVDDSVVLLVGGLETAQDQDGVLDGRLSDPHGLEPTLERGVLLDRAVLLERRGTHEVQLSASETRLEDVSGIHRPFASAARADDRVHLVDEDDEVALEGGDLVHRVGEALFEVSAVARAGEHRGQVERDDAAAEQLLGHGAVDDRLGETLDDRGLADTGLADQDGVVLRAAAQDLDRLLDLIGTADDGVELTRGGTGRQVGAELVEHGGGGCRSIPFRLHGRSAGRDGLAHALREGLGGHARAGEDLTCGRVLREHEREEEVFGVDVGRTRRAGDLEGVEQGALHGRRDDRAVDVGGDSRRGEALLGRADDGRRLGADALDGILGRRLRGEDTQHVQGVELALTAVERVLSGALEELLRTCAEEAAEVYRPLRACALACEVAGEELVERAFALAGSGGRGEVFGHYDSLPKVELINVKFRNLSTGRIKLNARRPGIFPVLPLRDGSPLSAPRRSVRPGAEPRGSALRRKQHGLEDRAHPRACERRRPRQGLLRQDRLPRRP